MAILSIRVLAGWYVNDTAERYSGGPVAVFIKGIVRVVSLWYIYDASDGNSVCKSIIGGCFLVFVGNPNSLHGDVDDPADGNPRVVRRLPHRVISSFVYACKFLTFGLEKKSSFKN